jgi:uncharacterized membrane protein
MPALFPGRGHGGGLLGCLGLVVLRGMVESLDYRIRCGVQGSEYAGRSGQVHLG